MATKMANRFRRSLSFPNHSSSKSAKALHSRSSSLPCRSQPSVSQIRAGIAHLHSWVGSGSSSACLCDGLKRLNSVHGSLVDLLQLPLNRDLLRRSGAFIDQLLDDFLHFADVYGRFQALLLRLKEECSAAEMAFRRGYRSDVDSRFKNLHRVGVQIGRLVSDLNHHRVLGESSAAPLDDESGLVGTIYDVLQVTSLISASVFGGISASFGIRKRSFMGLWFRRWTQDSKMEEMGLENLWVLRKNVEQGRSLSKKLHELEIFIVEIESCVERAFRSMINTRVSLLNLLTL
ncbi:hypothetical protein F511_31745 [Dorcoceras hygrometricum]|uniref:DUF241 domain protein n=1 Tax=Dorcoceras hygrometricum TaxID=472368 RepID=A0A2Z7BLY2_9LAMI|nr:hypothetical protein F511_31745 [Dorcoceras hygrometricum]